MTLAKGGLLALGIGLAFVGLIAAAAAVLFLSPALSDFAIAVAEEGQTPQGIGDSLKFTAFCSAAAGALGILGGAFAIRRALAKPLPKGEGKEVR